MRKFIYTLFVLVFLSSVAFGQKKIYKTLEQKDCSYFDKALDYAHAENNDDYVGYVKECFENGKVKALYYYDRGVGDSFASWHKNGQIKSQAIRKKGVPLGFGNLDNGIERIWHKNGQLWMEVIYKKGEEISVKSWDEDGKPSSN